MKIGPLKDEAPILAQLAIRILAGGPKAIHQVTEDEGFLLVLFISLRRLVLRLLYTILLFMGPRYPAILPLLFEW
jgi:hypothetical protein